jgi:hypothetical protein
MPGPAGLASSRLARLAHASAERVEAVQERCELCGETIPSEHRHVLDLSNREVMCTCRACAILFDSPAAGAGHYRLIPQRRLRVDDLQLADEDWEELRLPVDMAFFFEHTAAGRVMAYYPSPMGPTESQLELEAWERIAEANPVLRTLAPDVEALLVNRARGARGHWVVPIDECYALVGLIRARWRGFTGGKEVWEGLEHFFEQLDRRARPATRNDDRR